METRLPTISIQGRTCNFITHERRYKTLLENTNYTCELCSSKFPFDVLFAIEDIDQDTHVMCSHCIFRGHILVTYEGLKEWSKKVKRIEERIELCENEYIEEQYIIKDE